MAKDTLTFALEGEVTLSDFAKATNDILSLLQELSKEVGQNADISWVIEELHAGSAIATVRGENKHTASVENVVSAYETVGEYMQTGRELPYSARVKRCAINLTNIIDGKITAIRLETPEKDFVVVDRALGDTKLATMQYSFGVVKGIIDTLSRHKKLSFTLWDAIFEKPVSCYFKEGEEESMRSVWGKRAVVAGKIGRQRGTGRPVVVREVSGIKVLKEVESGNYRKARGVIPWSPDSPLPEQLIRRLRDA